VARVEADLGLTFPACLREVFVEYTSGLFFSWHLDTVPAGVFPRASSVSGGCELGLGWIGELQGRWAGRAGTDLLHVIPIANGDVIALNMRGHGAGPAPVEYRNHETGERVHLADDFIDFMNRWTAIGSVGPEIWVLEPLLGKRGLNPDGAAARKIRRWLRMEDNSPL
jgi:hypothetical protein